MVQRLKSLPLSAICLAAFVMMIPLEKWGTGLRAFLLWVAAAALLWESRDRIALALAEWRCTWARPLLVGAGFALGVAMLAAIMQIVHGESGSALKIAGLALTRVGPYAIVLPFIFCAASGERILRRRETSPPDAEKFLRFDAYLWRALAAWGIWMAVAAAYGILPDKGFRILYKEGGAYLIAMSLLILQLTRRPESAKLWLGLFAAVGIVVALTGIVEFSLGYAGTESLQARLLKAEFIRQDDTAGAERVVRAQYPFGEHNRLASYLLTIVMLAPVGFALNQSRRARMNYLIAGGLALVGIVTTGTRGAMIAVAAGLAVMTLAKPKILIFLIPAALAAFALLPAGMRHHAETIFNPATYRDTGGNVQYRLRGWQIASEMIRDRPIFGFGYGWEIYESIYPKYSEGKTGFEPNMPHAHNNVLEITAEMGVIGALIFLAYQAGLFFMAFRLGSKTGWRSILPWAILCLFVGLHAFGMTNFSLRRSVGIQVWMVWGMAHALMVISGSSGEAAVAPVPVKAEPAAV